MYLAQSQRGKNVNFSSCRVGGQKSKLGYRHEELGAVKAKKKKNLGMFRPAHCSLNLLCSQEREREKLIALFFLFTATEPPPTHPYSGSPLGETQSKAWIKG